MNQRIRFLMLMMMALTAREARAEPMTFFFEGHIDTLVDIGLDESVDIGTPFFGSYTFDPVGATDSSPDNPHFGFYGFLSPSHFSVTVGNYEFTTNDLLGVIGNDSLIGDLYYISSWSSFHSDGFTWEDMGVFLRDNTGTALDSDALPLTPPELEDFQDYAKFSAAIPGHPGPVLTGQLTSLTPEPGSLAILSFGAGIVAARRRRR